MHSVAYGGPVTASAFSATAPVFAVTCTDSFPQAGTAGARRQGGEDQRRYGGGTAGERPHGMALR